MPYVQLFVAKVYNTLNVEENIFRENNTINRFIDKWKKPDLDLNCIEC